MAAWSGVQAYRAGRWAEAKVALQQTLHGRRQPLVDSSSLATQRVKQDGPSQTLLAFMGEHGFAAPPDWAVRTSDRFALPLRARSPSLRTAPAGGAMQPQRVARCHALACDGLLRAACRRDAARGSAARKAQRQPDCTRWLKSVGVRCSRGRDSGS